MLVGCVPWMPRNAGATGVSDRQSGHSRQRSAVLCRGH